MTEGNTTATFEVDTNAVTQPVDVTIGSSYNSVIRTARLTIVPSTETVTLDIVSVVSPVLGGNDATGTVTLSAAAPSGGIVVTLGGSRAGLATVPGSVTVAQGETAATFTITTIQPDSPLSVLVTAQYDGLVRTALLKVIRSYELRRPPDAATQGVRTRGRRPWRSVVARNTVSVRARTSTPAPRRIVGTQTEDPAQRYYLYTPELSLLAETQLTTVATPPVEWEYVWFGGQPLAQIETATDTIAWYFNDHLGTPVLQTDASADVIWRVEREPFGNTFEVRARAARNQPLAFPGQEEQGGETSYNIFRWYRAGWGRYTQAGPLQNSPNAFAPRPGDPRIPHLYAYAESNPLRLTDPLGLKPCSGDCAECPSGYWTYIDRSWSYGAIWGKQSGQITYVCVGKASKRCSFSYQCNSAGLQAGAWGSVDTGAVGGIGCGCSKVLVDSFVNGNFLHDRRRRVRHSVEVHGWRIRGQWRPWSRFRIQALQLQRL